MKKIKGTPVSSGIYMEKIKVLERDNEIEAKKGLGAEAEGERAARAFSLAKEQVEKLKAEISGDEALIFDAHLEMLDDPTITEGVQGYIDQDYTAEYAVFQAKNDIKEIFNQMEDEYFKARSNDVEDIMMRVLNNLKGKSAEEEKNNFILVTDELYPSETLEMDFRKIKGIATLRGSKTSHTTILANNFKIPALISINSVDLSEIEGKLAIIDAINGVLIVEPDEETKKIYKEKIKNYEEANEELKKYIDKKAVTKSGKELKVYANIGSEIEAKTALENGAEGVGLFRSEFLFLGRNNAPDEDEQYRAYKAAVIMMAGKPVIVRTMDIGADKQVNYLNLKEEDNPQMGLRAIRISLKDKPLFKTQLRALLRASYYGDLRVMLPMIISVEEIKKTREIINECLDELKKEQRHFKMFKLGIMIETPAAAIIADELGKHADFFSIGTNDLVSYTLAIDRTNNDLSSYRDDYHTAVMRLLKMIADGAHQNDIEVGICGAMGADPKMLDYYLDIGIDEVSVSLGKILETKRNVIEHE